jgi:hypothetical protein
MAHKPGISRWEGGESADKESEKVQMHSLKMNLDVFDQINCNLERDNT